MKNQQTYTIVRPGTNENSHYDTNDNRFYSDSWERTQDYLEYLENLIKNYPEKFENCIIENNLDI